MCTGRCAATEVGIKLKNKAETWSLEPKSGLSCMELSYCFGPRGTTCRGCKNGMGVKAGAVGGGRGGLE